MDQTTLDIVGPTTLVTALNFGYDTTIITVVPTTWTITTAVSSGVEFINVPDGSTYSLAQITGPTTWTATLSAEYPINTGVFTEAAPDIVTLTYTLDEGTEVIDIPIWP
ncbi:hypothetical protein MMC13_008348 [Lambiella insularis]|nr:hypothetical protein [Lambiella insularis]